MMSAGCLDIYDVGWMPEYFMMQNVCKVISVVGCLRGSLGCRLDTWVLKDSLAILSEGWMTGCL